MATEDKPLDGKSRRRTRRPLLRIAIEVEGRDASGVTFSEETHTIMVNRNGARIALKHTLKANDRIIVTNLEREESCPFRVVERADTLYGNEAEWGVECLEPDRNFWGIHFPDIASGVARGEGIDVLLECGTCGARELAQLEMDQYRTLSAKSRLERFCKQCGAESAWEFGFAEVKPTDSSNNLPPRSDIEDRRGTKRFVAMLPLRLRNADGTESVTRTENLSKMGLCFVSNVPMESGDLVYLTVGPSEDGKKEICVRIAWRRPIAGSTSAVYGVRLAE